MITETLKALNLTRPKQLVRLWDPAAKAWLHLSGTGMTTDPAYAWTGTKRQARTLRDRSLAAGQAWPYRARPRPDPVGHPIQQAMMGIEG